MPTTDEIIDEVRSLPVEERLQIVESLLEMLNPPDPAIDRLWIAEAHRRLEELESGKVKAIPAEEVFEKIRARFGQ